MLEAGGRRCGSSGGGWSGGSTRRCLRGGCGRRAGLWRVMGEEDVDVVKLAHAVSRLVGTTVRAARAEERVRRAGGVEDERERLAALLELLGGEEGRADAAETRS